MIVFKGDIAGEEVIHARYVPKTSKSKQTSNHPPRQPSSNPSPDNLVPQPTNPQDYYAGRSHRGKTMGTGPSRRPRPISLSVPGICVILVLCLPSVSCEATGGKARVSVFLIGYIGLNLCPFAQYFMQDPLFSYSVEPISEAWSIDERRRLDRLYYPRTRKLLIDNFDMMVFWGAHLEHFTTKQINDLDYAFREAGMASFANFGSEWTNVWEPTVLYYDVPVSEYYQYDRRAYWVKFSEEREPVFTPFIKLGIEKILGVGYHHMTPRQGAVIWADVMPAGLPFLVSWRPGGAKAGMQWVCPDWEWWLIATKSNPYTEDLATNLILHSLKRPLIRDIQARGEARDLLSGFQAKKAVMLSVMEWADSFGANTLSLSGQLTDLEHKAQDAVDHYLEQDYPTTISLMVSLQSMMDHLAAQSVRLKDAAMFWVFVSEWLA